MCELSKLVDLDSLLALSRPNELSATATKVRWSSNSAKASWIMDP